MKVDDSSRLEFVRETEGIRIYTTVVDSIRLKRTIRIAYRVEQDGDTLQTALLFSTDTALSAWGIYRYDKARCHN